MIILEILGQNPLQMGFVQYDHVVQALPTYRADNPFAVWVLPGRTRCDEDFFDSHVFHAVLEIATVDTVAIADQESRRLVERKGFGDLLRGPLGRGIGRHVEVDDSSPVVTEYDKDVQHTEGHCRHGEEVASRDIGNMIVQKRPPGLRRRFPSTDHVFGHGRFGDLAAQQEQFGQDSGRAPSRVLPGHASNQVTDFAFDGRATRFAGPRFPPPIQLESAAMPTDDRFGLYDRQRGTPVWPKAREPRPKNAIAWT